MSENEGEGGEEGEARDRERGGGGELKVSSFERRLIIWIHIPHLVIGLRPWPLTMSPGSTMTSHHIPGVHHDLSPYPRGPP